MQSDDDYQKTGHSKFPLFSCLHVLLSHYSRRFTSSESSGRRRLYSTICLPSFRTIFFTFFFLFLFLFQKERIQRRRPPSREDPKAKTTLRLSRLLSLSVFALPSKKKCLGWEIQDHLSHEQSADLARSNWAGQKLKQQILQFCSNLPLQICCCGP